MPAIQLISQTGQSRSSNLNAANLVNVFPIIDPGAKSQTALAGTPGKTLFATLGNGPVRGSIIVNGMAYFVSGGTFYSLQQSGVSANLGTLTTITGPVSMATNGDQIMIADGGGYVYTIATNTFGPITDPDFPGAATVTYQDGYGIFNPPGGQAFYITGLMDFTTIDGLDFASAESLPDRLVRVISDHGELWLLGENSVEIWQNTGNADFPFERLSGARIERGCAAAFSVAKMDNTIVWLGDDGIIYRANGYSPQRISTEHEEYEISHMADVRDAYAFSYNQEGHKFYVITFPSAAKTFVYDALTGLWHRRNSRVNDTETGFWRASTAIELAGRAYVGDNMSGQVYRIDTTIYEDAGEDIVRAMILPAVDGGRNFLFHSRLEIDIESGVGLNDGQGSDPVIMVDWSDDGGHTYGSTLHVPAGKIGETLRRAVVNRLGRSLSRNYRFRMSDPVKWVVISATVDVSSGGH